MRAARRGEPVVGDARQRHRRLGVEHLRARLVVRQDLHVDPVLVHVGDAQVADVVELGRRLVPARPVIAGEAVAQFRDPEMLLEGDDALLGHARLLTPGKGICR